jgi:hypothetical protein
MDKYPLLRKSLTVGIILLFVVTSSIPSFAQNIDEKVSLILSRGGNHAPIRISGNDEFTPENGVTGGDGTANNPYLIENWVFVGSEQAISIWNTDVYFIIRNCTIRGFSNGIWFITVANGRIEKTTIDVSENGMIIENSRNIMITDNTVNSVLVNIGLDSAYNMNISRNIFTGYIVISGGNDYIFSYNTLINSSLHIYGSCMIYCNNFMIKPPYDIIVPLSSHVEFLQNYWWKPRLFPKLILGIIYKPGMERPEFRLPWFFIDVHPAQEPYDIPGMS